MITLDVDTREYLHVPYRGDAPTNPEMAFVPAAPGRLPDDAPKDWRPADFTDGAIRVLLGAEPHAYPRGTYAIAVRFTLGEETPERWAGWLRLR